MEFQIGTIFYKKYKSLNKEYWKGYEIIGSRYGNEESFSSYHFKTREDVLKCKQFFQVMILPYPNKNGLPGLYSDMKNSQIGWGWILKKELLKLAAENEKLKDEYKTLIFEKSI